MVVSVTGSVPDPASFDDPDDRLAAERALAYMDLVRASGSRTSGSTASSSAPARTHGSKTSPGRRRGRRRSPGRPGRHALVVPGSAQVRRQAEDEGLDRVFLDAGFEWRLAGCSMCLGMNPDILSRASGARRPPTATSKAARAAGAARTS
jgi:3-isopropylmalate/(R)-2-methylmalate dehydratase large subunit